MRRPLRRILLILGVLSLLTAILGGLAFHRWQKIAYLQQQFARSWEISYNFNGAPPMMPTSLRKWADGYFWKNYGSSVYPTNYPELLVDRFESLFLGEIKAIDIWYPGSVGDDLGGALSAFPNLEDLWIMDGSGDRPPYQWEKLAEALTGLRLRRLALYGAHTLDPGVVETLSRSKSLRELRISEAEITEESMLLFRRWRTLEKLVLDDCKYDAQALMRLKKERPKLLVTGSSEWGFCPVPHQGAEPNLSAGSNPPVRHTACTLPACAGHASVAIRR